MTIQKWGAVLSAGGALFGLAIFVVLTYEAWALWTGHKPITDYVRDWGAAHPQWEVLAATVVGLLVGHFVWHGSGKVRQAMARQEASLQPGNGEGVKVIVSFDLGVVEEGLNKVSARWEKLREDIAAGRIKLPEEQFSEPPPDTKDMDRW